MKILITTDLFTTETNGVVTSVKNLIDELSKKGHEIRVLTLSEKLKSYKSDYVSYIRSLPFPIYPDIRISLSFRHKFIKEIIEWKPDIIHCQCEFFSLQFAGRISKLTGAPVVHTYHTLYEQYVAYLIPIKRLGRYVVRTGSKLRLKKADCVIAPTHKVETALHGYGIEKPISIIPTGIDLSQHQVRITEERRNEMRKELGIENGKKLLINLGRLGNEKNLEELVEYFARVRKDNKNLAFLIVGDGPARKGLEGLAEKLGISDSVIFTGMVDPKRVQEYYQLGDVFVSASTSETQGLTYVEAAANGLPLLCRQDECLKDVIRQGENGYEYTNYDEFYRYLQVLVSDADGRKAAGEKAREVAMSFDKQSFGQAVEELYNTVLRNKKS